MSAPLFIDSDNAHGSLFGDVDDAFAIAALLRSRLTIVAVAATAGNTSEARAYQNNVALAQHAGFAGPLLRGNETAAFLAAASPLRIAALGPLTNVAAALNAGATQHLEVLIVGGSLASRGRWPPLWPHEFNLTKDRRAALAVFASVLPLTLFPLDVVRSLYATAYDVSALDGNLGRYLDLGARRWLARLRLLKGTGRFPIWDLAAALYAIDPHGFVFEERVARMRPNTSIDWGAGKRRVQVCTALDRDLLWERFIRLIEERKS